MIRLDGNIPEVSDIYDIIVVTARMTECDKYFSTHVGKSHKESGYIVTKILWNKNWLLEKGVNRYEVWAKRITGGEDFLWKYWDNPISAAVTLNGK